MEDSLKLPMLNEVLPSGLRYGANYLVEFEPHSLWYETSLFLCAQALRMGIRADYHTFSHAPDDVRRQLANLVPALENAEGDDSFRILDSYTVQTGFGEAVKAGRAMPREIFATRSMKMSDWNKGETERLSQDVPTLDRRRLHVDDNTSVLVQFNDETTMFEHFRTRIATYVRKLELAAVHSIVKGAYSESFYNQFEAFCDGIIDFKAQEEGSRLEQYMRVRMCRGKTFDSRWHRIRLSSGGEVGFAGISFGL